MAREMNAGLVERIETNVELGAIAAFGVAIGVAIDLSLSGKVGPETQVAIAAAGGLAAIILCKQLLAAMARRRPDFVVPVFEIRGFEPFGSEELILTKAERLEGEPVELVLTDADRVEPAYDTEPLVLDDILAALGPDSRVVRLFDPAAMPTPEQLRSRITGHRGESQTPGASSDASQALSEALAELRRSLR